MRMLTAMMVLVCASAGAGEKKVLEAEVPKPVLEAVARKYPHARKVGFEKEIEKGKTTYEVKIVDGAKKVDIDVSPDGKIMSEEEVISLGEVPDAVKRALAASEKYGKWSVKRVERVVMDEKTEAPQYEIAVVNGSQKAEVKFAADGKLLGTE